VRPLAHAVLLSRSFTLVFAFALSLFRRNFHSTSIFTRYHCQKIAPKCGSGLKFGRAIAFWQGTVFINKKRHEYLTSDIETIKLDNYYFHLKRN